MSAPVQDSIFPFISEELHLTGHRHPIQLLKIKCMFYYSSDDQILYTDKLFMHLSEHTVMLILITTSEFLFFS